METITNTRMRAASTPNDFAGAFRNDGIGNLSTAKSLVVIRGRRRAVTLVAQWAGDPRRHRDWHVTAYHTIPLTTRIIKAEASHFGVRWQAAELALLALEIEIEKEGI